MERTIHFSIIGCGNIGRKHAQIIQQIPGAVLTALIDTDLSSTYAAAADAAVSRYQTLEEFIDQDTETDVVIIATPNGYHTRHALKCLDAGLHIVVEKPLALTKADAEQIIFKALQVHKHVFVVMQNRYTPLAKWLQAIVAQGVLGDIFMVNVVCHWNRDERYYKAGNWHGTAALDGGTLFTQFSHYIDLLYWIFGDIQHINGRFANFNHTRLTEFEDCGLVNFEFVAGGIGSFEFSTLAWDKNMESTLTVVGANGTVKVGGQYMDKMAYCHIKNYTFPADTLAGCHAGAPNHNHRLALENVINVLRGQEAVATNALEGLKVVDIIERIYALKKYAPHSNTRHVSYQGYTP